MEHFTRGARPHRDARRPSHGADIPDYDEHSERGRRIDVLQRAENEFDPIPFDAECARLYGRIVAAGRTPRRSTADLMIAATAAEGLPLYTTDPDDFKGLDPVATVVPVRRPPDRR